MNDIAMLDREILEEIKTYTKAEFPNIVLAFFESCDQHMDLIGKALDGDENIEISKNAHALKSISGQLGALKFSETASKLETANEAGADREEMKKLYDTLQNTLPELTEELKSELKKFENG